MDNFIVSARKYRPQDFNTVVGQSHITSTLKNAIIQKQLAQAYLFCGPRGVGKTTCARIFAKTINCFNISEKGEACDKCESCLSFNSGASLNVYELDAASNNSVEDIRNLVDQVRFAPQLGEYKVYIIDEVHMLSTAAFNAFLKTLEEPPKHAKFILATTEKHKIIPTILSRCQVFNFNRIRVEDITKHLEYMANNEGVKYEQEALNVIAQKADGGLRDACSIFDQMVSFTRNNLTYKEVVDNLHVLDHDYYFKITDFLLEGNIPNLMLVFDEVLKKGFDGHNFIIGLGEHLRNVLISRDPQTTVLMEVSESLRSRFQEQAAKCNNRFLLNSLNIISQTDVSYKGAKNQRLLVEMALMQMANINASLEAEKKNDQIESTETSDSIEKTPKVNLKDVANNTQATVRTSDKPLIPFNQLKSASSFSLKETLSEVKRPEADNVIKEEVTAVMAIENKEVGLIEVTESIKKFAETMKDVSKSVYVSLTNAPIELTDDKEIKIALVNHSQFEKFQELKQDMLDFIRKDIRSNIVTLSFHILKTEGDDKMHKVLSPVERFKIFSERNPSILELKKRFDLEIDY
ncbi:MAG: DNA polymerase III subunit gamma/tau [Bacteroidia bacterium]